MDNSLEMSRQLREENKRLKNKLEELELNLAHNNETIKSNKWIINRQSHDIDERYKELNCFYKIAELVLSSKDTTSILQDAVDIIPMSYQFQDITRVRIIFDNREYFSQVFEETIWKQSSDIIVEEKNRGSIEVFYLEEQKKLDEGPFLKEERKLIDAIAKHLGKSIERLETVAQLEANNQQLEASEQQLRAANQQQSASEMQLKASNQQLEASEMQLKATNQQLGASEQQLKAANQQLQASSEQLVAANQQLEANNQQLRASEIELKSEISERKRNEQIQKILYNISNAINKSDSLTDFINLIKHELSSIIDTSNFFVALYDSESDTISLPFFLDEKDKITSFPVGKTLTNYVIKTKRALLANRKVKQDLVESGEVELLGADSKVWLGIPLISKDKVIGVFAVQSYTDENAYSKSDLAILKIISYQISISMERKKTENDLKLALLKAQQSDRLKRAFLSNMSHEIRTPLNGMLGFVDLLSDSTYDNSEKREFTGIIKKSSVRLMNTIDDIIDISKIEAGEINVSNSKMSLNKLLDELFDFFHPDATAKGISLICKKALPDKQDIVSTDNHKLHGVFVNLIKNALKFTKKGKIEFGYLIKTNIDYTEIEFFVIDSGIGIPLDRQNAIFNRFEQADIEDTQVFEGSGLGLAISKAYVEMLGGNIRVESKENRGSTFAFTIPYDISLKTKNVIPKSKTEVFNSDNYVYNNLNVLIVEDDEASNLFFRVLFKNIFNSILFAKNGKEAVDAFKNNPNIDLILMDIKMPVMNGYLATKEIRKISSDVIIIAQTAFALEGDRAKSLEAGCNDYITKPVTKKKLFDLISMLIS